MANNWLEYLEDRNYTNSSDILEKYIENNGMKFNRDNFII